MTDHILLLDGVPIIGVILIFIWLAARTGVLAEADRASMLPLLRETSSPLPERKGSGRSIAVRLAILLIVVAGLLGPIGTALVAEHAGRQAPPLPAMDEDSEH